MQAIDADALVYPSGDGERMAENTLQFSWIVMLKENLDSAVSDFVGGDLLWYPVEGRPDIRRAPDVLVALGRPKGHRGSYMQFREDGVAPQVVMEVLSPCDTPMEMLDKAAFYFRHQAQEFYVVDPDSEQLSVWINAGDGPAGIFIEDEFVSPLLGIRFDCRQGLTVYHKSGQRFRSFAELQHERDDAITQLDAATTRLARLEEQVRTLGAEPQAK